MEKIVGVHEAQTLNGVAATIYEVQRYFGSDLALVSDGPQTGVRRFELADGRLLKMVGRQEYKVEGTDEVFLLRDRQ